MKPFLPLALSGLLMTACGSTQVAQAAKLPPPARALAGVDRDVDEALKGFAVPGMAIAVVKDGEVVFAKGYGVRDIETKAPVTPQTLFAIGSVTKSFTAVLVGTFVDEGVLNWRDPVRTWLPEFSLQDPVASAHANLVDLLTHRTGLPRHDLVWYLGGKGATRQGLFQRLRHLPSSAGFREAWQYNNFMYMVAGIVTERVGKRSWEDLMKARLLGPLGMTRSVLSVDEVPGAGDFASGHGEADDALKKLPFRNIDPMGPAGSLNSSVTEMARWLMLLSGDGKVAGTQIVSASTVAAVMRPVTVMRPEPRPPERGPAMYGLGLAVEPYRGTTLVQHGGGIDGFISWIGVLPAERIGVVVLSNKSGDNPAPTLVGRRVLDRMLGLPKVDWIGKARAKMAEAKAKAKDVDPLAGRKKDAPPTRKLSAYAGRYGHPGYGELRIEVEGETLAAGVGDERVVLEHFHFDTWVVPKDPNNPTAGMKLTFATSPLGDLSSLSVPLQPGVDPIVFARLADSRQSDPAYLKALVGTYQLADVTLTVALTDGKLTLTVPGQPTYTLKPGASGRFDLQGIPGFAAEFDLPEGAKKAAGVTLHQPNGSFYAKAK